MGPSQNKVIGDIGESWEFSPDGLTMTVKVRQGVKWHNKAPVNGRALDVDDVVFSYDRLAAKGAPGRHRQRRQPQRARCCPFKATDKNTIVVKLKEPTSYITAIFRSTRPASCRCLPKETDTTFDIRGDQIGTGPFVLDKYQPSVAFTYKRNQDYFRKDYPYVDQVDVPDRLRVRGARWRSSRQATFTPCTASPASAPRTSCRPRRDVPDLQIYEDDVAFTSLHYGVRLAREVPCRTSACARPSRCPSTATASSTRATTSTSSRRRACRSRRPGTPASTRASAATGWTRATQVRPQRQVLQVRRR